MNFTIMISFNLFICVKILQENITTNRVMGSQDICEGANNKMVLLYNILPINRYIGNITIKCHNESMSGNRDPTVVLHQEISTLPVSIASDTRYF